MTLNELDTHGLIEANTQNENDEEFSIPLCIDDIISICKDFNSLGKQVQNQIDNILEIGVEEAIKTGNVQQEYLPHVKFFLQKIIKNPYFGEAASQAQDCLKLIHQYEYKYKINYSSKLN